MFLYYLINTWKKTWMDERKLYSTLLGWPTYACSYGKFSSHLGGIPAKSREIPRRQAGSLLIWRHCFYKSFLKKVRSHLGEPVHPSGPAYLYINSPLKSFQNLFSLCSGIKNLFCCIILFCKLFIWHGKHKTNMAQLCCVTIDDFQRDMFAFLFCYIWWSLTKFLSII